MNQATDKLKQVRIQNMKNCHFTFWFQLPIVINSIILFQVSESAVFNEITLEKYVDENWKHWLKEETQESKYIQDEE
jgi:hypothetical protein